MSLNTIFNLPLELDLQIRSYLTPQGLCKTASISKSWNSLNKDDHLWIRLIDYMFSKEISAKDHFKMNQSLRKMGFPDRIINACGGVRKFISYPHLDLIQKNIANFYNMDPEDFEGTVAIGKNIANHSLFGNIVNQPFIMVKVMDKKYNRKQALLSLFQTRRDDKDVWGIFHIQNNGSFTVSIPVHDDNLAIIKSVFDGSNPWVKLAE